MIATVHQTSMVKQAVDVQPVNRFKLFSVPNLNYSG